METTIHQQFADKLREYFDVLQWNSLPEVAGKIVEIKEQDGQVLIRMNKLNPKIGLEFLCSKCNALHLQAREDRAYKQTERTVTITADRQTPEALKTLEVEIAHLRQRDTQELTPEAEKYYETALAKFVEPEGRNFVRHIVQNGYLVLNYAYGAGNAGEDKKELGMYGIQSSHYLEAQEDGTPVRRVISMIDLKQPNLAKSIEKLNTVTTERDAKTAREQAWRFKKLLAPLPTDKIQEILSEISQELMAQKSTAPQPAAPKTEVAAKDSASTARYDIPNLSKVDEVALKRQGEERGWGEGTEGPTIY